MILCSLFVICPALTLSFPQPPPPSKKEKKVQKPENLKNFLETLGNVMKTFLDLKTV